MPRLYNPQRTLLGHWHGTVLPRIWFPMLMSTLASIVRQPPVVYVLSTVGSRLL